MVTQEKKTLYFTSTGPILRKSVMFVVNVEDTFLSKKFSYADSYAGPAQGPL